MRSSAARRCAAGSIFCNDCNDCLLPVATNASSSAKSEMNDSFGGRIISRRTISSSASNAAPSAAISCW